MYQALTQTFRASWIPVPIKHLFSGTEAIKLNTIYQSTSRLQQFHCCDIFLQVFLNSVLILLHKGVYKKDKINSAKVKYGAL
jgi:hypothetical protein